MTSARCPRCGGEATLAGRKLVANRHHKPRATNGLKTGKTWCGHQSHYPPRAPGVAPPPSSAQSSEQRQVDADPDATGKRVCTPTGDAFDPDDGVGP